MPYFITHYADFKGRCPNKPYWWFIISYQLIFTLLCIPYLWSVIMHLMADEQLVELLMQDTVALQSGMFISAEDVTQIMLRAMGGALLNIAQAGTITWVCTALAAALAIGLLVPTIAMTAGRLRDAGSSQLWWLAVLPSYLIFGLQCIAPNSEWVAGQGYYILSLLSSIPFLLFFAMLCKPSKLRG